MEQVNNFSNLLDASRPPHLSRSNSSHPPPPPPLTRSTSTGSSSSKPTASKEVTGSTRVGGAVSKFKTRGVAPVVIPLPPQSPTPPHTTPNRPEKPTGASKLPPTSPFSLPTTTHFHLSADTRLSQTQARDLLGGWSGKTSTTRRTDLSELLSGRARLDGKNGGVGVAASQVHASLNKPVCGVREEERKREEEEGGMDVEEEDESEGAGGGGEVGSRSEDEMEFEGRRKDEREEEEEEEDEEEEIGDDEEGGRQESRGVKRPWEETSGEWDTRYKRGREASERSPDHFEQYQKDEETSDPWNNTSPRALGATKQSHDPLSSIADLYPGSLPHLRRATTLTSTSSHLWDSKTTEEWKAGGDDLVRRFGELMGRITGIVARKTRRTEEFEKEMKEHRDALEGRNEKMEGTSKNMKDWAGNLFG